ncbi:MAG: SRPBCC family protein [Pseudomonadota bacterium]
MKFSSRDDINVPANVIFERISDFDTWERLALRRGIRVQRTDSYEDIGPGMAWDVAFRFRGKPRTLSAQMVKFDSPHEIGFAGSVGGLVMNYAVDLIALSPRRTRISTALDLKPETLSARLLLQSMRLARTRLKAGYKDRTAHFANTIEENYRPVSSA